MPPNLKPGQYQIGDFVFGYDTMFNVEKFDNASGWDVNVQDFQSLSSDELRFGTDTLKPQPIQLTINARTNYAMTNMLALTNDSRELDFTDRQIGQFIREWRADDVRFQWGQLKPLWICREDGRLLRVYGRPGKVAVARLPHKGQSRAIVAEFRRSDTLFYNEYEWFTNVKPTEIVTITRAIDLDMGDAPSWLRLFLVGPMTHPIISVGNITVELDYSLENGEVVEISSYPWERRVISLDTGQSLAAALISPYLDKLSFPADSAIEVSWTATNINTQVNQEDFDSYNDAHWWTDYSGPGAGTMGVTNGVLRWNDSGNQIHMGTKVYKTPTVTNYQLVGFTMESPMEASYTEEECSNRIIGRCNATRTEYLYWEITYTRCWFGYHKDGVDTVLSQVYAIESVIETLARIVGNSIRTLFGVLGNYVENWKYEAEFGNGAGEYASVLRINNHTFVATMPDHWPILGEHPYTTWVPPLSLADNRYGGLGMRATPRFAGQSTPGTISEFHMRDNPPPEVAAPLNVSGVIMMWRDAWQAP